MRHGLGEIPQIVINHHTHRVMELHEASVEKPGVFLPFRIDGRVSFPYRLGCFPRRLESRSQPPVGERIGESCRISYQEHVAFDRLRNTAARDETVQTPFSDIRDDHSRDRSHRSSRTAGK